MAGVSRRTYLATFGMGCGAAALLANEPHRRRPSTASSRDAIRTRNLPNVILRTHENQTVRFYDDLIKDKIVVINFMYATCDGICPGITANLVKLQQLLGDRIGRDVFMYSITLKPDEDSPATLSQYVAMHGVKPGWLFLTGHPDDIEVLRRKLGFVNPDPALDADTSEHIGNLRFGNERLQLWATCPGLANPSWIAKSVSWLDRKSESAV